MLKLNEKFLNGFVSADEINAMSPMAAKAHQMPLDGTGEGSDFLGWVRLP